MTVDERARATRSARRVILIRVAIGALLVGLMVAIVASGTLGRFSNEAELEATVDDAGALAPLLFVGLMVALVPLNVPGVVFVIPSTTLFGTVPGVTLSLIGGFTASAIGIAGARYLGREAFARRMPQRVQRWEERLARHGFRGVVVARMVTFLFQPLDWLCGLSRLPMRTVLSGTFVGLIPPTLVVAITGGGVLDLVL